MPIFSLPLIAALLLGTQILAATLGLRTPKNRDEAFGLGGTTALTVLGATPLYWLANRLLLQPFGLQFLDTLVAVLLIATLAVVFEALLHAQLPRFFPVQGNLLPQIVVGAAIVALPLLREVAQPFGAMLLQSFLYAAGAALVVALFYALREHNATAETPPLLRGAAIDMLSAGLLLVALGGLASSF